MGSVVVAPSRVVRSIETFADVVARYLMPVIRFVGHKDAHYESLERIYPGLIHERTHSGLDADLVIFDHHPEELLKQREQLSADSAYLFVLRSDEDPSPLASEALYHLNALTLITPEPDELLWHVRALLLLRDLSYSNGASVFPGLLSVDRERRHELSTLVDAVLTSNSCVVIVSSHEQRQELLDFLFGTIAEVIAPVHIDASAMIPEFLATDRFNVISSDDLSADSVTSMIRAVEVDVPYCALMVIGMRGGAIDSSMFGDTVLLSLDRWGHDSSDAPLLAYWTAAWKSHQTGRFSFYASSVIEQARTHADSNHFIARRLLEDEMPSESTPDERLTEILKIYQRLSLDSILGETERRIMLNLREQSPVIEAASHAAGIPAVTWHKRARRLGEKTSLIELLTFSRIS